MYDCRDSCVCVSHVTRSPQDGVPESTHRARRICSLKTRARAQGRGAEHMDGTGRATPGERAGPVQAARREHVSTVLERAAATRERHRVGWSVSPPVWRWYHRHPLPQRRVAPQLPAPPVPPLWLQRAHLSPHSQARRCAPCMLTTEVRTCTGCGATPGSTRALLLARKATQAMIVRSMWLVWSGRRDLPSGEWRVRVSGRCCPGAKYRIFIVVENINL